MVQKNDFFVNVDNTMFSEKAIHNHFFTRIEITN